MNITTAKKRVKEISNKSYDDETAHGLEDSLYLDFIKSIASGNKRDIRKIAKEILKTQEIPFGRWTS